MRVEAAEWQGRPVAAWQAEWALPELHVFETVGSTNDAARERAEQGAPAGTVVLADHQSAGRGRRGRAWSAAPGAGLLLSMVLRPGSPGAEARLSLRLGLAAAEALESLAPLTVGLKWPNDLLLDRRKVAGILCEGAYEAGRARFVIAGIGINLTQPDDAWPPELAGAATSLAASGHPVAPAALAAAVIAAWRRAADRPAGHLTPGEVRAFDRRDILHGRAVLVDGRPAGRVAGLAADGALLTRRGGQTTRIVAGTLRPQDETEELTS